MSIKDRRSALGLQRKDLAGKAFVDPRTLQLIEMGLSADLEAVDRLEQTLNALETGAPVPDWEPLVRAAIAQDDAKKFGDPS